MDFIENLFTYFFYNREQLNHAILALKENGDLATLKNRWWYGKSECDKYRQVRLLTLKH